MADELTPITREETYLNAISEGAESGLTPITREEMYLSAIAGESDLPADMTPITRREMYLQKIYDNGGGGGGGEAEGTVEINITQNGTITRNVARYASAEITTNVPNPSTGTKQITSNGTHDVTDYASAQVAVPNSYTSSDEGKVVSNGALVSQTSRQITQNGTVDTTLNDEVVVNVPTGITPSGSQTFTENGTYDVTSLAQAVVNVASGGGDDTFTKYLLKTLTDYENDTITSVPANSCRNGAFQRFSVPNATSIGRDCFSGAGVNTLFAPRAVLEQSCCYSSSVSVCVCGALSGQAIFRNGSSLTIIDMTGTSTIAGTVFASQANLKTMIMRSSSINTLAGTNSFQSTPFDSGGTGGTIYIPKSLYDHLGDGSALDYKSATNWSTIDGYGTITWAQIEGSIYENAYGDGTPISA